jgi:hypothetical protein
VHAVVDDHPRLAYAEVLPNAEAESVTGFVKRALAVYASTGSGRAD